MESLEIFHSGLTESDKCGLNPIKFTDVSLPTWSAINSLKRQESIVPFKKHRNGNNPTAMPQGGRCLPQVSNHTPRQMLAPPSETASPSSPCPCPIKPQLEAETTCPPSPRRTAVNTGLTTLLPVTSENGSNSIFSTPTSSSVRPSVVINLRR